MYVVAATYTTKPGEEDAIVAILEKMGPLSREEPGCVFYQAHRSEDVELLRKLRRRRR